MKILAIEKENPGVKPEEFAPFLRAEALKVWELKYRRIISEIYFSQEEHVAVMILDCAGREEALKYLKELPLVQHGLISFELRILSDYTGFERLFDLNLARNTLQRCSLHTPEYPPEKPLPAHAAATALVLYDLFGGELLKTRINGGWHYYNRIDGTVCDVGRSQDDLRIEYEHNQASWEEIMEETTPYHFQSLKKLFQSHYFAG